MSATVIDPDGGLPDRGEIGLSEIARELAELLEANRHNDESWSLDFWRIGEGSLFVAFRVRQWVGQRDWTVQRAIDPTMIQCARRPFDALRREVERAYSMLRNR